MQRSFQEFIDLLAKDIIASHSLCQCPKKPMANGLIFTILSPLKTSCHIQSVTFWRSCGLGFQTHGQNIIIHSCDVIGVSNQRTMYTIMT